MTSYHYSPGVRQIEIRDPYGCPPGIRQIEMLRQEVALSLNRKLENITPFTDLSHALGSPEDAEELHSVWNTPLNEHRLCETMKYISFLIEDITAEQER
jgi:hypothetical protein